MTFDKFCEKYKSEIDKIGLDYNSVDKKIYGISCGKNYSGDNRSFVMILKKGGSNGKFEKIYYFPGSEFENVKMAARELSKSLDI